MMQLWHLAGWKVDEVPPGKPHKEPGSWRRVGPAKVEAWEGQVEIRCPSEGLAQSIVELPSICVRIGRTPHPITVWAPHTCHKNQPLRKDPGARGRHAAQ